MSSKSSFLRGSTGKASPRLPAMTWRLCFSTNASNRAPLTAPPPSYNRSRYLGYLDDVASGRATAAWQAWSNPRPLPPAGTKFDMNCHPTMLGFVWTGPEKEEYIAAVGSANASVRASKVAALRDLTVGLLWFLQHDEAVPEGERKANLEYGLCADEFADNGHFPYQLYVREGRRLAGRTTFTEHDMVPPLPAGRPPLRDSAVAIGSFPIDSFPASAARPDPAQEALGATLEGYIDMQQGLVAPSTLPADMMLTAAVPNLIVPGGVSATHVAFSAIRLEPTWMLLGAAAGSLAGLATSRALEPAQARLP